MNNQNSSLTSSREISLGRWNRDRKSNINMDKSAGFCLLDIYKKLALQTGVVALRVTNDPPKFPKPCGAQTLRLWYYFGCCETWSLWHWFTLLVPCI